MRGKRIEGSDKENEKEKNELFSRTTECYYLWTCKRIRAEIIRQKKEILINDGNSYERNQIASPGNCQFILSTMPIQSQRDYFTDPQHRALSWAEKFSDCSYVLSFAAAEHCNMNSCSLNQSHGTSRSFDMGQLISNSLNHIIAVTKNHKTYWNGCKATQVQMAAAPGSQPEEFTANWSPSSANT